jgi:hypothetical protein
MCLFLERKVEKEREGGERWCSGSEGKVDLWPFGAKGCLAEHDACRSIGKWNDGVLQLPVV